MKKVQLHKKSFLLKLFVIGMALISVIIACQTGDAEENALRYDGLYQEQQESSESSFYLRFYEDGTVLGPMGVSSEKAEEAIHSFNKSSDVPRGHYSVQGTHIEFTTEFFYEGQTYTSERRGEIQGESLFLKGTYEGKQFEEVYKFLPVADIPKEETQQKLSVKTECNPFSQPISSVLMNSEWKAVAKKEFEYTGMFITSETLLDLSTGKEIKTWTFDENGHRKEAEMFLCLDEKGNIVKDEEGNPFLVNIFQARQRIETSIIPNRFNPTQKAGEDTTIYPCENCKEETNDMCSYVW